MPTIPAAIADQEALARELRAGIRGEVHTDAMTRGLYATDASLYQIPPLAVIVPLRDDDVRHVHRVAARRGLPLLPRGGGTSLSGQTTGRALVIDFSKHMNRVLEIDPRGRWVRVQPGLVQGELNAALADTGRQFSPETATWNRANVGGMIGNNSAGTRSIVHGKTIDHVLALRVLLASGEELELADCAAAEWKAAERRPGREGEIYRGVRALVDRHQDEIRARYPGVMRQVGGYNLHEFIDAGALENRPWNLTRLVVGSEGTLCTILEAKLRLSPRPAARALAVARFPDVATALRAVAPLVRSGPSAVELIDEHVLALAQGNLAAQRATRWLDGPPAPILIIEVTAANEAETRRQLADIEATLRATGWEGELPKLLDPADQAQVWQVRKAGLGLLLGMKGDAKPLAFIEDSAVPVERLPDYIAEVTALCASEGVEAALYAHASVGLLHVRPILNLKRHDDIERMKRISRGTLALVQKYGGSWSGEHGDGLVRSYANPELFGPEIYEAFRQLKRLFDPAGLMNPGKIVDAGPIDRRLRYGPRYRVPPRPTHFRYAADGGFDRAVELCSGVGACRKTGAGTMCPSYMATRDEAHSTRGRANALRLAMSGQLAPDALTSRALHDVFDLCLGCKACKAECPSNVDVAKLKSEFLAGYHAAHGRRTGERFFAYSARAAALVAGPAAAIVNRLGAQPALRQAAERILGLDARRPLPRFATQTFARWFASRRKSARGADLRPVATRTGPQPVLFADTYLDYHEPEIGRAAIRVLEHLGYAPRAATGLCCGRPLISHGFLPEAKTQGERTLRRLAELAADGAPILVCEPSCHSALVDDLPDLVDDGALARRVARVVEPIEAFLARELPTAEVAPRAARDYLVHGHCHQQALTGTSALRDALVAACPSGAVDVVDAGCCGMAGSFGYERAHYDLSLRIGEDRLFPAVRATPPETTLVACGFSCRHQIADGTGRSAEHLVTAVAAALGLGAD